MSELTFDAAVSQLVAMGFSRETAEARVRAELNLPPLTAPGANLTDDSLEDDVVEACDDLMRALGFDVVKLSQKRASKITAGVPDRWYVHRRRRIATWLEAKAAWGRQRPEQREFQRMCDEAGQHYVLGGLDALKDWLVAVAVCFAFDSTGLPMPTPIPPRDNSAA